MRSNDFEEVNIIFFFSNTLVGGAETNIIKIASELKIHGYRVHLIVLEDNGPLLGNCPIFYDSFLEIGRWEKKPLTSLLKFKDQVDRINPSYVSCFGLRVDLFVRFTKIFVLGSFKILSNIRATENWRKWYHVLIDRHTSFLVDKWVSNSIAGKNTFVKRERIDPNKIKVIYNFIELSKADKVVLREKIEVLRIGILANYKKSKGHFNLIEISKILNQENIPHIFKCAGNDYSDGLFLKLIQENNLTDNFDLQGFVVDKAKFFNEIDVFFLPSYIEGLPTSVIESMSCGIPTITSNVDGLPEVIVDGFNGFLAHPDDLYLFVQHLSDIREIDVRSYFVENSYNVLNSKFNKESNMKNWIEVFST